MELDAEGGGVMKGDAIDALIYLRSDVLLGVIEDQIAERFGDPADSDDVAYLLDLVADVRGHIRDAYNAHADGRETYSTGVPFEKRYMYPSFEPGPDGEDVPVVAEAWVVMTPDGSPVDPPHEQGRWVD